MNNKFSKNSNNSIIKEIIKINKLIHNIFLQHLETITEFRNYIFILSHYL